MDNLDKVRARQKSKSEKLMKKNERSRKKACYSGGGEVHSVQNTNASDGNYTSRASSATAKKRGRRRSRFAWVFTLIKTCILIGIIASICLGVWVYSMIDFTFGDDLSSMNLNISSKVYYMDAKGNPSEYAQFDATENRIWVPINKMPANLKNAFVAIEDQRFFTHKGVDIKRTAGATINYLLKGDSSYGGSTITQQLVKNITFDRERTKTRKVREMLRAMVLETKLSKEQILEMYMNTIYLGQGANGVEAAANIYFSKSVSELTLAECACIAGITQYPSRYDPVTQPEANAEKRKLVLGKMLELGDISKKEYDNAIAEGITLNPGRSADDNIQSYFLDHLFEEIQDDFVAKGYTEEFAANMIYNGGLKIYSTVDPMIQNVMEDYYEDNSNFPGYGSEVQPQSAMVITDPHTGEIKGIVGGRGKKDRNRGLNRATQSRRQPGSSIKPIAVYAPAIDQSVITQSTTVDDSPLEIGDWRPKNSGGNFRGLTTVRTAVTHSYNIPAVRVLEELTVNKSFEYMKERLHMTSISDTADRHYSIALGGFSNGITVMEMNGAYSALANDGEYIEPHAYTKIYDVEGKLILTNEITKNQAFTPAATYIVNDILKDVVTMGTGAGAKISGMDTCGKTGTTDESKDRWFAGYTPYYCGTVWFGYDTPRSISASGNPALTIWDNIMTKIHKDLPEKSFEKPEEVVVARVCSRTGYAPSDSCPTINQYTDKAKLKVTCTSDHEYIGTKPYMEIKEEEDKKGEDGEEPEEGTGETSDDNTMEDTTASDTENPLIPAVPEANPPAEPVALPEEIPGAAELSVPVNEM